MAYLPYINASAQRITLLIGKAAAVCGKLSSARRQRASLVTNLAFGAVFNDKPVPHFLTQHAGSWSFTMGSAHYSHYLSSQAAAGLFGTMVRRPVQCDLNIDSPMNRVVVKVFYP